MFLFRLPVKFLALVLGILLVFLGGLFILIIQRESGLLEKKASEQQRLVARTIVTDIRVNMLDGKPRSTLKLLRDLRGSHELARLEVLRRDGSPAFERRGGRSTIPDLDAMIASGEEREFTEEEPLPLHTMLFPLRNETDCRRCHAGRDSLMGVIVISHSLEDTRREIALSTRQLTALFSGLIILMGVALFIVVRNAVLVPLRELHRGAKAIGIGDLSTRIRIRTRDEFQDVAAAFNEMAGRVDSMYSGLEKIVEARTKEMEESFRLLGGIVSSMPGGIMLLDMQGRVKLINRYAKQLLGCEQETIIDKMLVEALPEAASFIAAAYEKAGRELFQEVEYPVAAGKRIPIGFSSTHYRGAGGGYEGLIISFRDLSDLKTLQTELINKERFAAMGRLVAGVAHEVRNPLFGISSIGQIFERELTDPAHLELVQALLSESRRLNQLVEDLLIYGRPTQLRMMPGDIRKLWRDVIATYQDEITKKGLKIGLDDSVILPRIELDPDQMHQVFLNLFRNALDASPPGTGIRINFLFSDHYITTRLQDEGAGIPSRELERVFDLFFTTKPKGTGLGLAVCRKIVEDHGGEISLTSEVGKGTVASVKIPYRKVIEAREGQGGKGASRPPDAGA